MTDHSHHTIPDMKPADAPQLGPALIAWHLRSGRHDLPWQRARSPYRVWVSEIMLQQTQVATAIPYFERFILRFPDIAALAAAPIDEVLHLWTGLGYYARARNLHRAAQQIRDRHGGEFPARFDEVIELPGIGRSTAGAILALSRDERHPILDGNVKRVLTRALGNSDDLAEGRHERALWQQAEALLPAQHIAAYTQGLMDLGASLCSTRRPACDACPLAGLCVARAEGQPEAYPVKTRKLKRGQREHALLWLDHKDSVWLVQRPQTGVWAGLWSLPEFESDQALWDQASDWPGVGRPMPTVQHALTHFDWTLRPCHWPLPDQLSTAGRNLVETGLPSGRWVVREQALSMGLPAPIRRLLEAGPPQ